MKNLISHNNGENLQNPNSAETNTSDIDSSCSTPFVSAPSSPGRTTTGGGGFFYSAPASPMHYLLSSNCIITPPSSPPNEASEDFDFDANSYPMSSADELFLNGEIRPMKLSAHLQKPQKLDPLIGIEENVSEDDEICDDDNRKIGRGRSEMKLRNRSLRRIRSMSPLRAASSWQEEEREESEAKGGMGEENNDDVAAREEDVPPSRSSSVGRNSKRWVSFKEFLYRSKSEGRNNGRHKYFWSSLSFSQVKDKKTPEISPVTFSDKTKNKQVKEKKITTASENSSSVERENVVKKDQRSKAVAARGKRLGLSAHELHYTTNRAQAVEMRKKTYLPYRQGFFGCIAFNTKGYGALNGFARALNSVSSN